MSLKKMDLVPQGDTHQFKIDNTNTLLHYTATVNGEPQEFPSDDPCYFQIKTDKTFVQTAKATVSGSDVALSSKDLANLPVGAIKTELLDSKDLNQAQTSDYYTGNAMTIANAPSIGQFVLKVVGLSDSCVQLYYDLRRGEQYMRTMFKGEWNPWRWTTQWN